MAAYKSRSDKGGQVQGMVAAPVDAWQHSGDAEGHDCHPGVGPGHGACHKD